MKNKIVLIVISLLINIIVLNIFRGYLGMEKACFLAIILYFAFTNLVFKQLGRTYFLQNVAIILLGSFIVHIPLRIIDFKSQLVSLPEFLCEILGVILGYFYFALRKIGKITVFAIAVLCSVTLYNNYNEVLDTLNYSNFFYKNTSKIDVASVPFTDTNNVVVNETLFNSDKHIILNIWATSCAPCIAEFPLIDSLYNISTKTSNIQLFTACILHKQDMKIPSEIVKKEKCSFPVLTIPNWEIVKKEYDMDGVPVTFLIKNRNIMFRGNLLDSWDFLNKMN